MKKTKRLTYAQCKKRKICVRCRVRKAKQIVSADGVKSYIVTCVICSAKNAVTTGKDRKRRTKKGICLECPNPVVKGFTRCTNHLRSMSK